MGSSGSDEQSLHKSWPSSLVAKQHTTLSRTLLHGVHFKCKIILKHKGKILVSNHVITDHSSHLKVYHKEAYVAQPSTFCWVTNCNQLQCTMT